MSTMPPTDDDVKAAREFIVSGGRMSGKATERILAALAAARERGAKEERERLLPHVLSFVEAQGCGCCGKDYDTRRDVDVALGEAMGVEIYGDGSGADWPKARESLQFKQDAAAVRALREATRP